MDQRGIRSEGEFLGRRYTILDDGELVYETYAAFATRVGEVAYAAYRSTVPGLAKAGQYTPNEAIPPFESLVLASPVSAE